MLGQLLLTTESNVQSCRCEAASTNTCINCFLHVQQVCFLQVISLTSQSHVYITWHALFNKCSERSSEPKQKKDECKREEKHVRLLFVVRPWAFVQKTAAGSLTNSSGQRRGHKNTYYYCTTSAESRKLLFWVVLSNKWQSCKSWDPHTPTSNARTMRWSGEDANSDSLLLGSRCSSHFLEKAEHQSVIYSLSGNVVVWSNVWYLAKPDEPHVSQEWGKPLETWKSPGGRAWRSPLSARLTH